MRRVYVETTIFSYLTARPSRNPVYAGHQQITREWWDNVRPAFDLFVSELVVDEASGGNADAAQRRLEAIGLIPRLVAAANALELAAQLIKGGGLPPKAIGDSIHVGIAATERLEFLLTWNCRHLANASMRARIESICSAFGFKAPIICTPEQLMVVSQ